MISFIHNVRNIIIKQSIHDLCHSPVLCQFVNIVFDIGIEIFKAGNQHVRIFQNLQKHNTRMIGVASHQTVYRINIPLILDLLSFSDLQQGFHDFYGVFFKIHPLDIAFVRLNLDPAIKLQLPQHAVGFAAAVQSLKLIFLHVCSLRLIKIIFQFIHQHISFHTKRKLMFHGGKQLTDTFPIYDSVRRG